jgi:hypothetical protein
MSRLQLSPRPDTPVFLSGLPMVEPEQFPSFVLFSGSGIGREWVTIRADGSHRVVIGTTI